MEFFKIVDIGTTEDEIQNTLTLANIEKMSTQLISIEDVSGRELPIGSVWGEFTLSRDVIRGGLRFGLIECPNALAWTITTGFPPASEKVVIHATINRTEQSEELIEEIKEFLDDLHDCLKPLFSNSSDKAKV